MKKIFFILTAALAIGISSCSKYLDQVPDDVLTVDDIFKSRANTDKFLANVYSYLPSENQERYTNTNQSGVFVGASDEAVYNWSFPYSTQLNSSTWAKTDGAINNWWNNYYRGIRNATYFMSKIDSANALEVPESVKISFKAEARALRAMYYFFLVRTYGPVVITHDNLIDPGVDVGNLKEARSPIDTCIEYIVSELDAASANLNYTPWNGEIGRITKGACAVFKEQALMLAASPLWNGNTAYSDFKNIDGTPLLNTTYDVAKWARAAKAAKDFIDEFTINRTDYALYKETNSDPFMAAYLSCRNVHTTEWNKEWIFARSKTGSYLRYDRTPKHVGLAADQQGAGALGATQAMVDAYFMKNGRPITDPLSGYVATGFNSFKAPYDPSSRTTYNQWIDREPRFYVGITYNNSYWLYGSNIVTNMEFAGNSGRSQSTSDVSPTGYIVRKAVPQTETERGSPLFRLAQVYLDYAEALNESDPGNADILKYLNEIRTRAGVAIYGGAGLPAPADQDAMRAAIRAERRVELAFETVRFFDTRRWKIAEVTNNAPIYGMNMTGNGAAFYTPTIIQQRVFRKERDYLFPIPNDEVLVNKNVVQNPGW